MKPIVIASANGHLFRNGGDETGVERTFRLPTEGADVLEAIVAGVTIVELDQSQHRRSASAEHARRTEL